jgi:hypothetical protein
MTSENVENGVAARTTMAATAMHPTDPAILVWRSESTAGDI